jgi:hypothetical protein
VRQQVASSLMIGLSEDGMAGQLRREPKVALLGIARGRCDGRVDAAERFDVPLS